jgi:beta-lactamase regulating signal transducer with metallopeptidase domain
VIMNLLMTPRLLVLSHVAAQTFVTSVWQGLLLVALVFLSLRLLPPMAASMRFVVWAITFLLSIALPLLRLPSHSATSLAALPASAAPLHVNPAWGTAIVVLWLTLALTRTAQLLAQARHLRRLWLSATPVLDKDSDLRELRAGRRIAELCTSTEVESPNVIGFFSPRLLIPAALFTQLSEQELDQIVLHECAHLKRGDDWSNLLQKIALAVFPLNPAAFWLDRRLSLERELACDATVVRSTAAPLAYARCLARLAEHRLRCQDFALALSARGRQSGLAHRVQILLAPAKMPSSLLAGASLCMLMVVLIVSSLSVAHAPQLISFTGAAPAVEQQASYHSLHLNPASAEAPQVAEITAGPGVVAVRYIRSKPVLANAAVASADTLSGAQPLGSVLRRLPITRVRTVSAIGSSTQPRVALADRAVRRKSTIHSTPTEAIPAVFMIPNDLPPSYAAVPFGNGWLILQL